MSNAGDVVTMVREQNAAGYDDTRRWVDPNGYTLSTRVWRSGEAVQREIDTRIRDALASGESAVKLAESLEQYLNPELDPVQLENGRFVHGPTTLTPFVRPPHFQDSTPAGLQRFRQGSYYARRLARTEITRALGKATIDQALANPIVKGIRWALSRAHPEQDICDEHATAEHGMGPGVWPKERLPPYPAHPQDLCNLEPAADELDELDLDGFFDDLADEPPAELLHGDAAVQEAFTALSDRIATDAAAEPATPPPAEALRPLPEDRATWWADQPATPAKSAGLRRQQLTIGEGMVLRPAKATVQDHDSVPVRAAIDESRTFQVDGGPLDLKTAMVAARIPGVETTVDPLQLLAEAGYTGVWFARSGLLVMTARAPLPSPGDAP